MMEKIERQDALIKVLTTRGTEEESGDVFIHENSKCSKLQFYEIFPYFLRISLLWKEIIKNYHYF